MYFGRKKKKNRNIFDARKIFLPEQFENFAGLPLTLLRRTCPFVPCLSHAVLILRTLFLFLQMNI